MKAQSLVVLTLAILGGLAAACDEQPGGTLLVTEASSIEPSGRVSPNPLSFSRTLDRACTGGFTFAPSFHVIVTAGARGLTLDHVTIRMIDGSSLGGPTVTIPQSAFAAQTSSLLIPAGATGDFLVRPDFGCLTIPPPLTLAGNVFLFDPDGRDVMLPVEGRVQ